ncbi:MAG: NAD(P)-dependent oxidoreductase [Magnetococcales bacterium]|nr:NAD(P)-dependent oxidoreductase [Magnetococcales bacterium]
MMEHVLPQYVAFIGLGVMGLPMAGHLAQSGHHVTVYNRTLDTAKAWKVQYGGAIANSPAEAASKADVIFACVGNDDDLRSVVLGEQGIMAGMKAKSLFVDHTTTSAQVARELSSLMKREGKGYLDAPVSGGQAGAENGQLTIMVGGEQRDYDLAEPIMSCYARSITHMGEIGSGQLTKMVNQIFLAGLIQSLAEGLAFSQKAGLDGERVLKALGKGAAQSWQLDNRGETMLAGEYDFGFAVDWMRKDLGFCLDEARRNGAQLPVTALVDQFYSEVVGRGGNRFDTSSLMLLLSEEMGKK